MTYICVTDGKIVAEHDIKYKRNALALVRTAASITGGMIYMVNDFICLPFPT